LLSLRRLVTKWPFAMKTNLFIFLAVTAGATWAAEPVVTGPVDARMFRYPAVSAKDIAFVYAGDIWVVPKSGGTATRLSSPRGEESFPRFSPDGATIAFTGNYDGNQDIYTVPTAGGLPRRITYHGGSDRMVGWYPDGKQLLFATSRTSQKDRFNQLYRIPVEGGVAEQLPVPYGEFGAISPDGRTLAFTTISVDFRTWKRYRGGMNPDIWLFDLEKLTAKNITQNDADDSQPMWHGSTLYLLSDRDEQKRWNIWACDTKKEKFRQVTHFKDYDVRFPSIGTGDIVFENGGQLYLLGLADEKAHPVEITVVTDRATLKPRAENVSSLVQNGTISPTGKRALFEARGEIFSVPAEHGVVRNVTRSSGVAERYPTWSPDGKLIAYWSDRTGEYELTMRHADGTGEETTLTRLGPGFRYQPQWSPDSKKIAFVDKAMKLQVHDLDAKETSVIDQMLWLYHGELNRFNVSWSADSRWLTYAKDLESRNSAIALYDFKEKKLTQATSGFYDDNQPVFDPDGKYLYYRTGRSFEPVYSDLDNTWVYPNSSQLVAVPLRKEVPSPLAPRNDEETDKDKDKDKKQEKKDEKKPDGEDKKEEQKAEGKANDKEEDKKDDDKKTDKSKAEKPKPVEIDLADFERRAVLLPPKAGNYADLAAVSGKLLYRRLGRTGADDDKSAIVFFDFEKREEKTMVDDAGSFELSADRKKLLVRKGNNYHIIEPKESQKLDKTLATSGFELTIDPVAEWKQIFTDAWRLERDLFYDPGLHGVDWNAMRERYGKLLQDSVTRWDVNYVIGELIGELNASHTYRGGGDTEPSPTRGVGYLGVEFSLENGAFRIKKIIQAAPWDVEIRSPLSQPGLTNVHQGDYLLAVNGEPLDVTLEPYAAFQGLANKPVLLTVNEKPTREGAREVLVQTLSSEARLRHLAWINSNRERVEKATDGRVGYIYVPDTGRSGQNELVRQFRAQFTKPGLIIDERFNSGGQIPDRFVEMLGRQIINYWGVRDGKDWSWPATAHNGAMAMLVNGWSGSGGDCFPYYFKKAGLGPLIGLRTWGGLIGMTGAPPLVDGGNVTVPTFGIYDTKGDWIIEGYGVDPDIEVVDDPGLMAKGRDPQLERAIQEVLKSLKREPPAIVHKPKYPKRS
jgi:tricorn protease